MAKALDGVLVIDTTSAFWAALGVTLLADFGAEVIKVEELAAGAKRMQPPAGYEPEPFDYLFELANRNKRSLAVDLSTPEGTEILRSLVEQVDAFVTDRVPGDAAESEWSYERLKAIKPDVIYAAASGFGPRGSDRDAPALDELAAGRTGMMPILPQPGQPPVYPGTGQVYTSVMLAFGIMTALNHRRKTGEGQRVDVSLLAGNMYGASLDLQAYLAIEGERFLRPISRMDVGNPMSGPSYPAADGRWVTLTMPDTGRYWPRFASVVGLDPDDPRFDSHEKRCEENRLELIRRDAQGGRGHCVQLLECVHRRFARRRGNAAHRRRAAGSAGGRIPVVADLHLDGADRQAERLGRHHRDDGARPGPQVLRTDFDFD